MSILSGFLKAKRHRLLDTGDYQIESAWTSASTVYMSDDTTTVKEALEPLVQNISEIKVVNSLPEDAASHPTTLYLIVD